MMHNTTQLPSTKCCYDQDFHPQKNVEPSWNGSSVFLEIQGNDPEQLRTDVDHSENVGMILTDF